jgi:hypothetical protein
MFDHGVQNIELTRFSLTLHHHNVVVMLKVLLSQFGVRSLKY